MSRRTISTKIEKRVVSCGCGIGEIEEISTKVPRKFKKESLEDFLFWFYEEKRSSVA
jgi:hypothetical protein